MSTINKFLKDILNQKYKSIDELKDKYPSFHISFIKKGNHIINKGSKANKSFVLIQGSCDISNIIDFSDLNIIDSEVAPDILGYYEQLSNFPFYTSYVLASSNCYVYEINSNELDEIIKKDAELCYLVMLLIRRTAESVQIRNEQYHLFSGEDILGYYLYNISRSKQPYELNMSREDLSKILYINLRTLYRYIDKLKKLDYLTVSKRKIIITRQNFEKMHQRYKNVVL